MDSVNQYQQHTQTLETTQDNVYINFLKNRLSELEKQLADKNVNDFLSARIISKPGDIQKNKRSVEGGILKKRCSENIQQIYRKAPVPKCDFYKVAK